MIELLGVGMPGRGGQWLLHRVCTRIDRGTLTVVVAGTPAESAAFLDAVTGQAIPRDGRVWVERRPLMYETASRIRTLVADVSPATSFTVHRSILWNTLVPPGYRLTGLLRFPRRAERQSALRALGAVGLAGRAREPMSALTAADRLRVALACGLASKAVAMALRGLDAVLGAEESERVLVVARGLARAHPIAAVAALATPELAMALADRVIVLADGCSSSMLILASSPTGSCVAGSGPW